jgi:uncharacterized membrane protein
MIWFLFAFLSAVFHSIKDLLGKLTLKNVDEYVVSWALRFFSLLTLVPLLILVGVPSIGTNFLLALIVSGTLNTLTTIMYMKALKHSDLSVVTPMTTFVPLFLLVTSPIIVGEFPGPTGFFGVLLIVMGSYILQLRHKSTDYLAPFKALLKERGPRLMLGVALIWSITSNFDKIGVQESSPIFWTISTAAFMTTLLFPIMIFTSRDKIVQLKSNLKGVASVGVSNALLLAFQMIAIEIALVTYVISVKRLGAVISVFLGYFFLKEKNIRERLLGAAIMVIGVLFITLF